MYHAHDCHAVSARDVENQVVLEIVDTPFAYAGKIGMAERQRCTDQWLAGEVVETRFGIGEEPLRVSRPASSAKYTNCSTRSRLAAACW